MVLLTQRGPTDIEASFVKAWMLSQSILYFTVLTDKNVLNYGSKGYAGHAHKYLIPKSWGVQQSKKIFWNNIKSLQ